MRIYKLCKDLNGYEYEIALMKARYVYPRPDNPEANTIEKHAQQIYDSEMLERVICETWENEFRPLTYANVEKFFTTSVKRDKLLSKQRPYVQTKYKRTVEHTKEVFEYTYEFHDIFHVSSESVIECKTYTSETGLKRHKDKIRERRSLRRENLNDYYLLCKNVESDYFEVEHFRFLVLEVLEFYLFQIQYNVSNVFKDTGQATKFMLCSLDFHRCNGRTF